MTPRPTPPDPAPRAEVAVLCGGLATRLGPVAARVPKFLVPVAGRPFGEWLLERLAASGFTDVVLCVGHLGAAIEEVVGDGRAWGLRVRYAWDGETPRGTGGAIRAALPLLAPELVVTYGDSYLTFDYRSLLVELAAHREALGVMAVYDNRDRIEPSNAAVRNGWVVRYDKSRGPIEPLLDHIDYGATALRREAFDLAPEAEPFGLDEVTRRLAAEGRLRALEVSERFYEVGSPGGLAELDALLSAQGGHAR